MCISEIQPVIILLCVALFQVTQKSGAQVRVLADPEEPGSKTAVSFLLQGSEDQVLLARCVLENLVIECEPVSEVLEVPQTSFGRIIGKMISLTYILLYFSLLQTWNSHKKVFKNGFFRSGWRKYKTH